VRERLARWTTPASSHAWAWVLLVAPFVLGLGVALPVLAVLGLLWPVLRARERAIWVLLLATLVALPFAMQAFDRMTLPMRPTAPLATVLPLASEPWSDERAQQIDALAAARPGDPYARFGQGWLALRRGDGAAAEAAFRDVLGTWAEDDRALDNLGTALIQQGRTREAIEIYQQAAARNPKNAVAYFNLSQAHLQGYEFDLANKEIARASSLDFDGVREYKNQPARNGALDPVPDWLSPRRQWEAVRATAATSPAALPPAWQDRAETTSPRLAVVALVVGLVSFAFGKLLNRGLPLYRCINCDRIVCRRCAERRRAQAMCASCARVARGAASADFSRILLARERERSTRVVRGTRLAFALTVPGAGLLGNRRVWRALFLLVAVGVVLTVPPGATWPYAGRARVGMAFDPFCLDAIVPIALIVGLSILGHFADLGRIARRHAALARPLRGRPRVSTQVHDDDPTREAA
jgi:tetratricopeptide (TPR) repeat protein